MVQRIRERPSIPDHQVYRKIGGGSYGEVWLAKSITGSMRAVKVVWRNDFNDDKTFEREFDGILKFEPISRDHPSLVHILHVGKGTQDQIPFYYYIMELGDDIYHGSQIQPAEYCPRTLDSDLKEHKNTPIAISDCLTTGLRLAQALEYLHKKELAHRDVKPSNIIFVEGKAKLADIGLVAARDQLTFVGTEGFVPPEGPGSAQADVYSLGKVLYEMSTGQDRLEFPAPPNNPVPIDQRKSWFQLNQVICDICNPLLSQRKIQSATTLVDALQRIQQGKKASPFKTGRLSFALCILSALLLLGLALIPISSITIDSTTASRTSSFPLSSSLSDPLSPNNAPPPSSLGTLKIRSTPLGADVYDRNQNYLGTTPLPIRQEQAGSRLFLEFRAEGFKTATWEGSVPHQETLVINPLLAFFSPPKAREKWVDWLNNSYLPNHQHHRSSSFITHYSWNRFLADLSPPEASSLTYQTGTVSGPQGRQTIVYLTEKGAKLYCKWLTETCLEKGFLTPDDQITALKDSLPIPPSPSKKFTDISQILVLGTSPVGSSFTSTLSTNPLIAPSYYWPFRCKVSKRPYGSIKVSTIPNNPCLIHLNGIMRGVTPHTITKLPPGTYSLELEREGYQRIKKTIRIIPHEQKSITISLVTNQSVVFGSPWKNSLGIPLIPIQDDLMVAAWETRVQDYKQYLKSTNNTSSFSPPSFPQGPNHPVVFVNRRDAQKFCQWLTTKERQEELISDTHHYRLPTDSEWSTLNALSNEDHKWPAQRELQPNESFAWGTQWPPPQSCGNFADQSAAVSNKKKIPTYMDSFPYTAPVGSFPPNQLGLYDLEGNVHEWVSDAYSARGNYGVTRGGGWRSYQKANLFLIARSAVPPNHRNDIYGFRIVLSKKKPSNPKVPPTP